VSKQRTKRATDRRASIDQNLAKALTSPLRVEILDILNRRVASPNEIAEELGRPLGTVAYHVRRLQALGCIELVREEPRRGAVEHYYRAVARPFFSDADLERMPASARGSLFDVFLRAIWSDVKEAAESGMLQARDDVHISHSRIVLDDEGWTELSGLLEELLARIPDVEAASTARLAERGHEGMAVRCTLMQFLGGRPSSAAAG
jgi:DNA-binding transcriptional ArsR family regulator